MAINEDEIEEFLEHHGVRGMKWGQRTAKSVGSGSKKAGLAVGRGTKKVGLAVGRGTKKTIKFSRDHPKIVASIAVGSIFAASILRKRIKGNKLKTVMLPDWSATDKFGKTIYGFDSGTLRRIKTKDLPKVMAHPMGPIGSTSIPRIKGAIPLPKIGG